jgi:DNA-binding GntR family transcriptional regulator
VDTTLRSSETTCCDPRYADVAKRLRSRIGQGDLQVGDRLPGEHELASAYCVTRNTVRRALAELVADGLIETVKGRGSFIARPRIAYRVTQRTSFSEVITIGSLYRCVEDVLGHQPTRLHCKVEATSSGDALAHLLCCPAGAPLLAVTSVMADGPGGPPFEYCRTLFRADRVYLDVDLAEVMAAGGPAATHSLVPQHPSSGR